MTCGVCGGVRLDESQRFCGRCGARLPESVATSSELALPGAAIPQRASTGTWFEPAARDVRVAAGEMCPTCGSMRYRTSFTFWHYLAAIVFIPFGFAVFLAPVKICERGHAYGLGRPVVVAIKILAAVTLVAGVALGTLIAQAAHGLMHAFDR